MEPDYPIADAEAFKLLKHDIKNQLSNINLGLSQLKFELTEANAECLDYLEMIALSVKKIDDLLNRTDRS